MKKVFLLAIVAGLILVYFLFDLGQYLNLEYFAQQQEKILAYRDSFPVRAAIIFFVLYVLVTGLSLPGAAIATLIGGAIFGLVWGTVLISFASVIGASCAFLISRHVLRDSIQNRYRERLQTINKGIEKDGAVYLFTLRMVPLFPFFVINLVMGLTPMRLATYFVVSQIGMLPGTIVYVNAGTQLAKVDSVASILSPALIASFALLGIFPLIAKFIINTLKTRKALGNFRKPKDFDFNTVVIGAGSAGLVAAYIAAAVKAKVALIEKGKMGGDCLNTGCVPSKAIIRTAKFLSHVQRSQEFGVHTASAEYDFKEVMERVRGIIGVIEHHDSVERYTGLGVDCFSGHAYIESPYCVDVEGQKLTTRSIVVASGAEPAVPALPGIDDIPYYTSDTIWEIEQLPRRLLVLGGGPIGCELSQAFARLGSEVTQVQRLDRIMPREDPEFSEMVLAQFRHEGIDVRLQHTAKQFDSHGESMSLICDHADKEVRIEFDVLLIAVGRRARVKGFGLEELGIDLSDHGTIEVNEFLETNIPNIYAIGDVAGPYQFTHFGSYQATSAASNALLRPFFRRRIDYSVIPWATFTEPEVARVGLNEQEAKEKNIDYEVTVYDFKDLSRAIADSEASGLVKVLTPPGKDRILGVTIAGEHAGDLIHEFVLAMQNRLGLGKILGTIHIYPTLAESARFAAGNWKRNQVSERTMRLLRGFNNWRRK
ncbi:MAG: FAD-dependent oxidoreductase [Acidiferrobacterales bacterium]|nr:FAD-dependent oxidoreductase [Acidiferrobacterales bacterium]